MGEAGWGSVCGHPKQHTYETVHPPPALPHPHRAFAALHRLWIFHTLVLPCTLSQRVDNWHLRPRLERLTHVDRSARWVDDCV
ncbi:MAG: hypothetical protein MZV64_15455 [Ignavibacteriales bacterium]|nr:hypothetical protein [Ignavibacteriales bacterium]